MRSQVDRQFKPVIRANVVKEPLNVLGFKHNRQDAVLKAVVIKNLGKARSENGANPIIQQRPGRVFPGRTTSEIVTSEQNGGFGILRLIHKKIRVRGPIGERAPIHKEPLFQSRSMNRL